MSEKTGMLESYFSMKVLPVEIFSTLSKGLKKNILTHLRDHSILPSKVEKCFDESLPEICEKNSSYLTL